MDNNINTLIDNIVNNKDTRASLSMLRAAVKDSALAMTAAWRLNEETVYYAILKKLEADDAKIRKNTALLLGDVAQYLNQSEEVLDCLYNAYEREEKKFVRASYLVAIYNYDYRKYYDIFKKKYDYMTTVSYEEDEKKHFLEELDALKMLVITMQGVKKHEFTGYDVMSELVLVTNRKNVETLRKELIEWADIDDDAVKTFSAGLLVKTDWLNDIIEFRPYQEMFFKLPKAAVISNDALKAAETLVNAGLTEYLEKRHRGDTPFYFRVECKTKMELDKKSAWVKAFSRALEEKSGRKLVNTKSDYEFEIRLIEAADNRFNCMIKLYTIKDTRFEYRKEHVAASIRPDNAATLVTLAREYMISDAQVLDPFCGVGTMLIERQKQVKANTSYGIDKYGDAIEKAQINTKAAGQIIHYINKDFFDFTHEYSFDEIFTDMPYIMQTSNKQENIAEKNIELRQLYKNFFVKAGEVLKVSGRIIMYTRNREYALKYAKENGYNLLKHIIILEKAGTDLLIFEKKQGV